MIAVLRHDERGFSRLRTIRQWVGLGITAASGAVLAGCSSTASNAGAGETPSGVSEGGGNGRAGPGPVADAGIVTIERDGGTPISPLAFGQNYWDWVDWAGDGVTGLTGTQSPVQALALNVVRAGGYNNDRNGPPPAAFDTAQLDAFVAYCRAVGAEPILQVPVVSDVDGGPATAQTGAEMVTYANVIQGYGIKYWSVGDEPDLYSQEYDGGGLPTTAADYCTLYRTYVAAMKAANAAGDGGVPMTFLGPELSHSYVPSNDWLTPFLDGCKDYVDVVSVHRYPYDGAETTAGRALDDVSSFKSTIASLSAIVAAHARPGTPLAITESNLSYDYLQGDYTPSTAIAEPTTYYAGLWTADVMGAALQNGLWTLAFWDIGDPSSAPSVLGFLQNAQPTPAYYTEQMVTTSLRGAALGPVGVPAGFSVYATYDAKAGETSVLVLNKTTSTSSLTLAIDSLAAQSFTFPALSVSVVQIPDASDGGAPRLVQYTPDEADAGIAPHIIQ